MSYTEHFQPADDYIKHTNAIVATITDPGLKRQYIGFIATSAVTAFELAIKDVFCGFAERKHNVFGNFVQIAYRTINGRITLDDIKNTHLPRFGDKYARRFKKELDSQEQDYLRQHGKSIRSSYGQILVCRHKFVHQGVVPDHVTFEEIVNSFAPAQQVIHILNKVMVR